MELDAALNDGTSATLSLAASSIHPERAGVQPVEVTMRTHWPLPVPDGWSATRKLSSDPICPGACTPDCAGTQKDLMGVLLTRNGTALLLRFSCQGLLVPSHLAVTCR